MKYNLKYLKKHIPWLLLLLAVDFSASLVLWLSDIQRFLSLTAFIFLGSFLLFFLILGYVSYREQKQERAFFQFLTNQDEYSEKELLSLLSGPDREHILHLGNILRKNQKELTALLEQVLDYEEYVESWAHEIKTPLSLLTLLLDNRREELPESLSSRLDYIRNQLQESTDQMLFYSRVRGTQKDYLFERLSLEECIAEVLEDYRPLLEEKDFQVTVSVSGTSILSDRRSLCFLLRQLISNSVKYCRSDITPELIIKTQRTDQHTLLSVIDNGIGVRSCDLPYLFTKGFTGDTGIHRRKATGMGLYLAKELADDLNIGLDIRSQWQNGFEALLSFPILSS